MKISRNLKAWLSFVFLSLMWGTSFKLIKDGLDAFDPFQVGALRMSISALAFLPFFIVQAKKTPRDKWKYYFIVGFLGTAIPSFLFPIAETRISGSLAGTLNSLTPLFTLVLGLLFYGYKTTWSKVAGVLMGFIGATLLILRASNGDGENGIWHALLVVLATACYATSSNTVGKFLKDQNAINISAISFVLVGIPAMFYLFSTDFVQVLTTHEQGWESMWAVTILSLGGTVISSIIFFRLLLWTSPVFASTVTYFIPIIAVLWGVYDGEHINIYHLIGMALVLVGVYLSKNK